MLNWLRALSYIYNNFTAHTLFYNFMQLCPNITSENQKPKSGKNRFVPTSHRYLSLLNSMAKLFYYPIWRNSLLTSFKKNNLPFGKAILLPISSLNSWTSWQSPSIKKNARSQSSSTTKRHSIRYGNKIYLRKWLTYTYLFNW